jgi:hypothetical protein
MPKLVTQIVYDVDQAIRNLNKLNETADKANKEIKEGFEESGQASSRWKQTVDALPGSIGQVVTSVGRFTGVIGLASVGIAAAGAAIGGLIAQFVDLPRFIGDATAELETFREGTQRIRDAQEAVSTQQDNRINREFVLERRRIAVSQARVANLQATSDEELRLLDKSLNALKGNITETERLEERLARRRESRGVGAGGFSPNADIRAATLLENAQKQAQQGNIDRAEELVKKAQSLKGELENQVFFLQAAEDANLAIDRALERQIEKTRELESRRQVVEDRRFQATNEATRLGAERKLIRERQREALEVQEVDKANRGLTQSVVNLNKEFITGRSELQKLNDTAAQTANGLKNLAAQNEATARAQEALRTGRGLAEAAAAERRGEISFGQLDTIFQKGLEDFSTQVADFANIVERQQFGGFDFDINRFDRLTEDLLNISKDIAARRLNETPTPSLSPVPAGGPPPTINIRADVKGFVNEEVIQEITDNVRRELRREVGANF